jgi:hypothetical protein
MSGSEEEMSATPQDATIRQTTDISDHILGLINEMVDGHDAADLLAEGDLWLDVHTFGTELVVEIDREKLAEQTDYELEVKA